MAAGGVADGTPGRGLAAWLWGNDPGLIPWGVVHALGQ
jgi:hypothetical protein